jgi:hypothetical protein
MGKSNGIVDNIKSIASTTPTSKSKRQAKKFAKQAVKAFAGEKPKTSLVEKVKNAYNKATGRKTVSMEMDGKTFTGTEKVGKRSVVKVKNPELGSRKIVDVYTTGGDLKRQRIVDRDASGKKIQVIKRKG